MEVDTNELLRRIGMVLRVISNKMDRLIEIGERVEGQVRLPSEEEVQTFSDAKEPAKEAEPEHPAGPMLRMESYRPVDGSDIGKIVEVKNSPADPWRECTLLAIDRDHPYGFLCRHSDPVVVRRWWCFARIKIDEPAKEAEPEHPAGPMPDPGEGYRILKKDPPEDLQPGDEYRCRREKQWIESNRVREGYLNQLNRLWYRRKIEQPAEPSPAWEPKVGDWVKVTRPKTPEVSDDTLWLSEMDRFDGAVMQVEEFGESYKSAVVILAGANYAFKLDWLAPAEYRKPVLPADAGKECEFSDDGQRWLGGYLDGWLFGRNCWVSSTNNGWKHCRIKKDA